MSKFVPAIISSPANLWLLALVFCAGLLCASSTVAANGMTAKGYAFIGADWLAPATALPTWHAAVVRHREQRREFQTCLDEPTQCRGVRRSLQYVLSRAHALDQEKQVRLINGYINQRRYRRDRRRLDPISLDPDRRLHSHWSTLLEFLTQGGDCEDFASAKYFLLRELGFAADDVRIVVTRERRVRGNHAVVAIRLPDQPPGQRVWLLDTDRIYSRQHYKYRFRYALNESSIWDHESDDTKDSTTIEM